MLSHETFKKVTQKNRQPAYKNDKLVVGEKSWTPITSSVTQACKGSFASMGSSPSREICTVDYATSEELRRIYTELQEKIQKKHEEFLLKEFYDLVGFEEFVLRETLEKVQEVFNKTEGEEQIEAIVKKARDDTENSYVFYDKTQKIPIISLDTFIKEKTGVCRHRAMLFLVLASKLKEDGFLMGEVRQVRDMVQGGAHAWNLYCSPVNQPDKTSHQLPEKPNVYLLDAMWNTFGLIKQGSLVPNEKHYLKDGEKTISDKLKRHINKLEQSVKEFVGFGWFFDEDADRLEQSLAIFRSSQSGLLAIRKSSNKPEIIIEFKNEPTDPAYAFTLPKEKFNQKLINNLRKELTTKTMTNDLAKKVVDKYLAEIGGSVRLTENGKCWVYRGAGKPLEEFVP